MRAAPPMAEHAALIQAIPDGPWRDQLLDWYRARNVTRFGAARARWYREEYEWIRHRTGTRR